MIQPNKRIRHKQETLAEGKDFNRWRLWLCFEHLETEIREAHAKRIIKDLEKAGYRAKVWSPLSQHKMSGHIHVVVLCTFREFCKLAGIPFRTQKTEEANKDLSPDISPDG